MVDAVRRPRLHDDAGRGRWSWGLELVRYGWGEETHGVERPRGVTAEDERVAYAWDEALTEWYVNDRRGLEHGYTVQARPAPARGPLVLVLAIRGGLAPAVSADGRDVRFADDAGSSVLTYADLTVFDADGAPLAARWEPSAGGLRLSVDDQGARYPLTIDPIAQQAYLKASNTDAVDDFGAQSVNSATDSGAVYAFEVYATYGSFAPFGAGCLGSNALAPAHSATVNGGTPERGELIRYTATDAAPNSSAALLLGVSNTLWGAVPLPLSLGFIGADPSCNILLEGFTTLAFATDGSGSGFNFLIVVPRTVGADSRARLSFTVASALLSVPVNLQFLAATLEGPVQLWRTSNTLRMLPR